MEKPIAIVLHLDPGNPGAVYGVVLVSNDAEAETAQQIAQSWGAYEIEGDDDVADVLRSHGFTVPREYREFFIQ